MATQTAPIDRRTQLLDALAQIALQDASAPVSLRQFAIGCGVSEPTLRHHFGDRKDVVIAIIRHLARQAEDFLAQSAKPGPDLQTSVRDYFGLAMQAGENPLFAKIHAFALVEAIHDPEVAEVYLQAAIEPSLLAIERRLSPFLDPEGADPEQVRDTAFLIYAPIISALLHQRLLRGETHRPLDTQRLFDRIARLITATPPL